MILFAVSDGAWTALVLAAAGLVTALASAVPGILALLNSRRNAVNLVKSDAAFDARLSIHDEKLETDTKPAGMEASAMAEEKAELKAVRDRHTPATGGTS